MFPLPFLEWKLVCRFLGLDLDVLANSLSNPSINASNECFHKTVKLSANQLEQYLGLKLTGSKVRKLRSAKTGKKLTNS